MPACVWSSEDNFGESVLSLGGTSQIARLPSECLKPSEASQHFGGVGAEARHEILGFSRS